MYGLASAQEHSISKVYQQFQTDSMMFDSLARKVVVLENKINDRKLTTAINTGEAIITKQNYLITGLGTLIGGISLLIIIIGSFTYLFNVLPLTKRAKEAVEQSEIATNNIRRQMIDFDQIIEERFDKKFTEFENKMKEERLNQLFIDLCGNLPTQRNIAIEQISNVSVDDLNSHRVHQLLAFLNLYNTKEKEKEAIVEILIQKNSEEIKNAFKYWWNVDKDNSQLKVMLIEYYTKNGFENYLLPVTHFIRSHITPHVEFEYISRLLSSYGINNLVKLINSSTLVDSLDSYNKKEICKKLNENKVIWNIESEVNDCLLCKEAKV